MISTVIINAQKQDRDRIIALLSAQVDFKVVAHGKDGYDALKLIGSLKPDIAILDNHLEFIKGEELPPLLKARSPSTAVVILTTKMSDYQLCRAAANEVNGFICKETDLDTLPAILRCVCGGGCFISPLLAARVLRLLGGGAPMSYKIPDSPAGRIAMNRKGPDACPSGYLSKMELQILTCVGKGLTSAETAKTLDLAIGTVRNYISGVMHKIGLHSRSQMVRYAFSYGLVPLLPSGPSQPPEDDPKVLSYPEKKLTMGTS